jgi:hypothetical protein
VPLENSAFSGDGLVGSPLATSLVQLLLGGDNVELDT